jgi:hypothetical protein
MTTKRNPIADFWQAQDTYRNRNHSSGRVERETCGTGVYVIGQWALRGYGECYSFNEFPFYNVSCDAQFISQTFE